MFNVINQYFMNCPKCGRETDADAVFCKSCGYDLSKPLEEKGESNVSSILLFVFLAVLSCSTLINELITRFADDWYLSPGIYGVCTLLWTVRNMSFVLPALAIRNKPLKIVGLVLAVLYVVYAVVTNIVAFVDQLEYIENYL